MKDGRDLKAGQRVLKPNWKNIVASCIVIGAFGVMAIRLQRDWDTVRELQLVPHPWSFSFHLGLLVVSSCLWIGAWRALIQGMGHRWSMRAAASTWLTANLGKYVPGKVMMLAGRVALCQGRGISRTSCVGGMMLEHALLVVAAAPFLLAAVLLGVRLSTAPTAATLAGAVLLAFIVVRSRHWPQALINAGLKLLRQDPVEFTVQPRVRMRVLLVYMTCWLLYGLSGWALSSALGMAQDVPASVVICSFVSAWLIAFLSFVTPAGLGVREAVLVALLRPYIPTTQGMLLAVVARLSWTVIEMVGVALGAQLGKNLPPPDAILLEDASSNEPA
jgi:hypothetical protein